MLKILCSYMYKEKLLQFQNFLQLCSKNSEACFELFDFANVILSVNTNGMEISLVYTLHLHQYSTRQTDMARLDQSH